MPLPQSSPTTFTPYYLRICTDPVVGLRHLNASSSLTVCTFLARGRERGRRQRTVDTKTSRLSSMASSCDSFVSDQETYKKDIGISRHESLRVCSRARTIQVTPGQISCRENDSDFLPTGSIHHGSISPQEIMLHSSKLTHKTRFKAGLHSTKRFQHLRNWESDA